MSIKPSDEFSVETPADWTLGRCCADPLRPPLLPTSILPTGDFLVAKNAVSRNFRIADHPSRVVEPPVAIMGGENWVEVSRAEKGLQNDKQENF